MRKLYLVFDKLPSSKDGGLIATYVNFVQELSEEYEIVFVSVFRSETTDIPAFANVQVMTLLDVPFDNRFYMFPHNALNGDLSGAALAIFSSLMFFPAIPLARRASNKILRDGVIIAVAPLSAVFLSSKLKFYLEVHINFEYFWGGNLLGRLQSLLMAKPALTIFRNKSDATKGSRLFKSSYMYNTIDASQITFDTNRGRVNNMKALFVGRLVEQKNPLFLLNVAAIVRKALPSFSLDIYGAGPLDGQLRAQIQDMKLDDCVHLKGFVSDKSIYSNYDMLWVSSINEGFGLVIVEAAANGVPTISTRWGDAVYEVIEDESSGFVADSVTSFADKALAVFQDSSLRNNMGNEAYQKYRKDFSQERHKENWIRLISEY